MKVKYFALVLMIPIIFLIACKKDENQNQGITITPVEDYYIRDIGDVINFTIKVESKDELVRFRITQTIDNSTTTILDKPISGKKIIEWFDYEVPNEFEEYGRNEIKLVFSAYDLDGNTLNRAKIIYIDINERTLTEYSGNNLYSSLSNQFNAYDLLTNTPKYSSDSTSHVVDITKANINDSLSKSWASPSGVKFVKLNSFDYGNATDLTVKNAYNSGIKNDTLRNIMNDDIIITKVGSSYIALKFVYVIDDTGFNNDKYIFNIKR